MKARRICAAAKEASRSVALASSVMAAFQSASRKLRWKERYAASASGLLVPGAGASVMAMGPGCSKDAGEGEGPSAGAGRDKRTTANATARAPARARPTTVRDRGRA